MNQPSPRPKWEHTNNICVVCGKEDVALFAKKEYMDQAIRAVNSHEKLLKWAHFIKESEFLSWGQQKQLEADIKEAEGR